ncbi:hypothetical protein [Bowmanella sp. JS7-9]|uniref:Uncharacterized protein n=1 Tax=Pseudobowmanella zhangzhouensis TaxID=1537679 RepID=A0ABW1XJ23_9ALTE|nr:hypothetical protein [Bowmanella sp. JS7-9]TBX23053.1 hypothetical protein TK45_07425 [Bowmanella sp. JS7-9]
MTTPEKPHNAGALAQLHQAKRQNVAHRSGSARFLARLADEDHQRIALLIRKWLEQDALK